MHIIGKKLEIIPNEDLARALLGFMTSAGISPSFDGGDLVCKFKQTIFNEENSLFVNNPQIFYGNSRTYRYINERDYFNVQCIVDLNNTSAIIGTLNAFFNNDPRYAQDKLASKDFIWHALAIKLGIPASEDECKKYEGEINKLINKRESEKQVLCVSKEAGVFVNDELYKSQMMGRFFNATKALVEYAGLDESLRQTNKLIVKEVNKAGYKFTSEPLGLVLPTQTKTTDKIKDIFYRGQGKGKEPEYNR